MRPAELRARAIAAALAGAGASIPITNQMVAEGQLFAPVGSQTAEAPPASPVGVTYGRNRHNTSAHVGGILLLAGGVILVLHLGGFRLAFDVGMGRG